MGLGRRRWRIRGRRLVSDYSLFDVRPLFTTIGRPYLDGGEGAFKAELISLK